MPRASQVPRCGFFPHNDLNKLERLLVRTRAKSPAARILVATESVFSMDGDLCPLREIVDLTEKHDALLLFDEAHGFGVLGESGMGLAEREQVQRRVTFQMGTLSKAAGLSGGYLAASREWIDLLTNRARSFIYSTAPPPALAHAAMVALRLIRSAEGRAMRAPAEGKHPAASRLPARPSSRSFSARTKPPCPHRWRWRMPVFWFPPSGSRRCRGGRRACG